MKNRWKAILLAVVLGTGMLAAGCGGTASEQGGSGKVQEEDVTLEEGDEEAPETEEAKAPGGETEVDLTSNAAKTEAGSSMDPAGKADNGADGETNAASVSEIGSGRLTMSGGSFPTGGMIKPHDPETVEEVTSEEMDRMDRAMRAYTPVGDSLLINKAKHYYYYEQLNEEEQDIYDTMFMITEDPVTEDNYNVFFSSSDPSTDECYEHIGKAYFALMFDHPELFWLYNDSETSIGFASDGSMLAGKYPVFFGFTEPYEDFRENQTAFNEAAEAFLEDINLEGSEEEIAREIHDKLIETVTYDDDVMNGGEKDYGDLAHTAYGALVANSKGKPNYAVCDGYSLAYVYLLQQAGLEAAFIGGEAGDDFSSTGGHAWSVVKVDGKWYEVDSTWNDMGTLDDILTPDIDGYEYFLEALTDSKYRDLLQHQLFEISTEEISDYIPDEETLTYTTKDGEYAIMLAKRSVHIRDDESMGPYGAVIATAPIAK